MVAILAALLFALSLCADCFAVSACSSVTIKELSWKRVAVLATVFAVVQAGFLLSGWLFGDLLSGFVGRLAPIIGFLLLLYVGGSMVISAVKGTEEALDWNGIKNILIGAVATSIDALAAGMSMSMDGESAGDAMIKVIAVLVVTFISVILGVKGGMKAGSRYGRPALLTGGIVLILIGLNIVFNVL